MIPAPINEKIVISFANNNFSVAEEQVVQKEFIFGRIQHTEQLKTHTFLSHKRSSAQGIAGRLFQELKENYKIFLDSEATFNLHNLQLIVKYTGLFIFILSEGIFDSFWCLEGTQSFREFICRT